MTFEVASPVIIQPEGSGFSIAMQFTKTKKTIRITVTEAAQAKYFGGPIIDKNMTVLIGRDADKGRIRMMIADDGAFKATKSFNGSAFVKVNRWNLLPEDKRPTQQLQVAIHDDMGVTLMVPDYSRVATVQNGGGKHRDTGREVNLGGGKPENVGLEINLGGGKSVNVPRAMAME